MSKTKITIMAMVMMGASVLMVSADDRDQKPEKLEIRHSMLGYRDTLIFYSFKEQRAILVLGINNKDETFSVTGKIHLSVIVIFC